MQTAAVLLVWSLAASAGAGAPEFGTISWEAIRSLANVAQPARGRLVLGPDVRPYTVRGIDVSTYQGAIHWHKVAAAGVAFAYIKATEGSDFKDDRFATNWKGARVVGIPRGAYHFYNFCASGAEQAANFRATVPKDSQALPPMVDLEVSASCRGMPSRQEFLKHFSVFLAKLEAAYRRAPVLYTSYTVCDKYLTGLPAKYKLWIADTHHTAPELAAQQPWAFWQYSFHGRIAGIPAEVDLDVFNGDADAFALFARGS